MTHVDKYEICSAVQYVKSNTYLKQWKSSVLLYLPFRPEPPDSGKNPEPDADPV